MLKSMKSMQRAILSVLIVALVMTGFTGNSYAESSLKKKQAEVVAKAEQLIGQDDLSKRGKGTIFEPKEDDLDDTSWYTVWSEAQRWKEKAHTLTERQCERALDEMSYYQRIYAYPISHDLAKDGFYKGAFKLYNLDNIGGGHNQKIYKKNTEAENAELKGVFDGDVRVIKMGNEYDIRLDLNKEKAQSIEGITLNYIGTKPVPVHYQDASATDPYAQSDRVAFTVTVPGELTGEDIVITSLKYKDAKGVEKHAGPFGVFIDYKMLVRDEEWMPEHYKETLKDKAAKLKMDTEYLPKMEEDYQYLDDTQKAAVEKAIKELGDFAQSEDISYDKLNEIASDISDIENGIVLKRKLGKQVDFGIDDVNSGFYSTKTYTAESVEKLKQYYKALKDSYKTMSLKQLVLEIAHFREATNLILRYNTSALETTIAAAKLKNKAGAGAYTPDTYGSFLIALSNAEKWVAKAKEYRYLPDETDEVNQKLKAAMEALKSNGQPEPEEPEAPEEKQYTVLVSFLNASNQQPSSADVCLERKARLTSDGENHKIMIRLKPMEKNGQTVGVIKTLYYYDVNGEKKATRVEATDTVNMGGVAVAYPSKVELPVDGKTKNVLCNMDIESPQAGPGHVHDVILAVDYTSKVEGYSEEPGAVNKDALIREIALLDSEAWKQSAEAINRKNLEKLNELLAEAKKVRDGNDYDQDQVNAMLERLSGEHSRINRILVLQNNCKYAESNYMSDLKSGNYTEESLNKIKALVDEGQAILAKELISDEDIARLEAIDFNNLYKMLEPKAAPAPDEPKPSNPEDTVLDARNLQELDGVNFNTKLGDDGKIVFTKGVSKGLAVRIAGENVNPDALRKVLVNGEALDPSSYDVIKGSIIIRLHEDALNNMQGENTLRVETSVGYSEVPFKIVEAPEQPQKPEDPQQSEQPQKPEKPADPQKPAMPQTPKQSGKSADKAGDTAKITTPVNNGKAKSTAKNGAPKTGDMGSPMVYAAVLVISAGAMLALRKKLVK